MTDFGAPEQATQWLGEVPVAKNGTMTLPMAAREHLNLALDGPDTVLVFTEAGRVTVTGVPATLPEALLRLVLELSAPDTPEEAT
jgi:hypothetical protein